MFWNSKIKNSGMYNTLSIPANLVNWTQSGSNWNGVLTEATMLANNIDYTRVMNVVPQWTNGTNSNGWVTTISRSSADNNIYITLTRGSGGSAANTATLDTEQTFTANKEFDKKVTFLNNTNTDSQISIKRSGTGANYIEFFQDDTRLGTLGKGSASNQNLSFTTEHGDLVLNCPSANSINCSSRKITNVATPTANDHAATKGYVDGKNGDWKTIKTSTGNISTLNENWTQVSAYANNENSFSVADGGTYQVMFKCNTSSGDIYASCILATNAANYDNMGVSSVMYWNNSSATPDTSTIQFAIYLKQGQFKLFARRPFGTNANWNTGVRIYARKIAQGNIA